MRKAINENPIAQLAVIGLLAVLVGFLLLTRVMNREENPPPDSTTTTPAAATAPAAASTATATPAPDVGAVAPDATAPQTDAATEAAAAGKFVAGPGLPAPIVSAYARDQVVVLLVTRHNGIEDRALRRLVKRLEGRANVALFQTNAGDIAKYSRITQGVQIDRVPAMVALTPRSASDEVPVASVSYGFRGYESVVQAVRDAEYRGGERPYHPE